jgi:CubicO group peptidase (beta-lactamase class C family)
MRQGIVVGVLILLGMVAPVSAATDIDPALVAALARFDHDEHADLRGVVVMRDGRIVAERYYNGATADSLNDVRSAGKSITALLVGIAIDQGKIQSVDDSVAKYWAETRSSAIGDVSLRDVLTMRSGLDAFDDNPDSPGNEDRMDEHADPLALMLSVPRADPPGTRYVYNSATAYIAGVVVAKATGQLMAEFARATLLAPLGITQWQWATDASGYTKGQGNLFLTTRGFATIGEMVRGDGLYHGQRIVSTEWLRDALSSKVGIADSDPYADGYGYFWYAKTQQIDGKPVAVSFASGNGGNKIYVVPSRRLVVAITSSAYGSRHGQKRSEQILLSLLASDGEKAPVSKIRGSRIAHHDSRLVE